MFWVMEMEGRSKEGKSSYVWCGTMLLFRCNDSSMVSFCWADMVDRWLEVSMFSVCAWSVFELGSLICNNSSMVYVWLADMLIKCLEVLMYSVCRGVYSLLYWCVLVVVFDNVFLVLVVFQWCKFSVSLSFDKYLYSIFVCLKKKPLQRWEIHFLLTDSNPR